MIDAQYMLERWMKGWIEENDMCSLKTKHADVTWKFFKRLLQTLTLPQGKLNSEI